MIVIIDNYDSFTYNLYQSIATKISVMVIRNDQITIEKLALMSPQAIIISPGPGRPEQAGIGIELVKTLAPQIPILGVCLGHQIIALAFKSTVCLAPTPVHGKCEAILHPRRGLYQGMSSPFQAGRYHSLMVSKQGLSADLIIEAESTEGMIMGMRHAHFPTYGVQFHPESILTPEGDQLLHNFICLSQNFIRMSPVC